MRRLKMESAEEEGKVLSTALNGVSRIAWSTTQSSPKRMEYAIRVPSAGGPLPSGGGPAGGGGGGGAANQNKVLKNILNALQLNRVEFSISRLDDHSKVVFPFLFLCFCAFYWLWYSFTQGGADAVDVF